MSRKAELRGLLNVTPEAAEPAVDRIRVPSGAVRAMGLSLGRLQDEAAQAQTLRTQIGSGDAVVEIDPSLVDGSFVADRLDGADDAGLADLVQSIAASGQQVPALVRPSPDAPGRFQIAYGHRRLRAVQRLGLRLRAVVQPLDDAALVIAQGQENLGRRDLSFIERALFATRLAERGFDRATLNAALSVHTAEMTRYLAVTRAVPLPLLRAIGPAPKAGRTRWLELARAMLRPGAAATVAAAAHPDFASHSTDERFARILDAASGRSALPLSASWHDEHGRPLVRIERNAGSVRLTLNERLSPGFGQYLIDHLDELHHRFTRREPSS